MRWEREGGGRTGINWRRKGMERDEGEKKRIRGERQER